MAHQGLYICIGQLDEEISRDVLKNFAAWVISVIDFRIDDFFAVLSWKVYLALASGEISDSQADKLAFMLEKFIKGIELSEIEERIKLLEEKQNGGKQLWKYH